MTPGWAFVPCIVWVLPEEVTPYAKIVTVWRRVMTGSQDVKSDLQHRYIQRR